MSRDPAASPATKISNWCIVARPAAPGHLEARLPRGHRWTANRSGIRHTPERVAGVLTYRALAPAFADEPVTLVGKAEGPDGALHLHALDRDGAVVTRAELEWRP